MFANNTGQQNFLAYMVRPFLGYIGIAEWHLFFPIGSSL